MDSRDTATAKRDELTTPSAPAGKTNAEAEATSSAATRTPAVGDSPPMKKAKLSSLSMPTADAKALTDANSFLESEDAARKLEAGAIADTILAPLGNLSAVSENLSDFAQAAFIKGKSMLGPLLANPDVTNPKELLAPLKFFKLAVRLDPEHEEADECIAAINQVLPEEDITDENIEPKERNHPLPFDVVVIGAGASGVGMGVMLNRIFGLATSRVLIVERGANVGHTFDQWPEEMRFISPSFNNQGWTNSFDLNSIAYGTSPAFTLHTEHPTGKQYARYLRAVAEGAKLNIRTHTEVTALRPFATGDGFELDVATAGVGTGAAVKTEVLRSRYVIWAAGEFQYPRTDSLSLFPGAEHCLHNSTVRSWRKLKGDDFVVIGGYESGMDAAFNLSTCGKRCTVVASTAS